MGVGPSKIESLPGGVPNFLLEKGGWPWKEGIGLEMGVFYFFYYFTDHLHLLCVFGKSEVSFITFRFFSLLS